ncbi:hypothetical protein J2T17_007468 [Paenibacillus mucilaginosus]|uniref:hypothetical protein n=1 Tax=Paenibacillus mucilaginosus TaxID=61624 RepID=UPI003D1BD29C
MDQLINNSDGLYDSFGHAWFTVPAYWLEERVKEAGYAWVQEFQDVDDYTYDTVDGWLEKAIMDRVLLGCGTGDQNIYNGSPCWWGACQNRRFDGRYGTFCRQ